MWFGLHHFNTHTKRIHGSAEAVSARRAAVVPHQEDISENLLEVSPNLDFLYSRRLCSSLAPLFTNKRNTMIQI